VATVAQLAGVSSATVSKVLNGQAGVSAATRQRVEALLREHGYRRPAVTEPAAAIEVVFYGLEGDLATHILGGVERVARQHDLAVVFTNALNPVQEARSWSEQVLARRPLGVIAVHSQFTPDQQGQLAVSGIPVVALDPMGEPTHDTPSVGATNWNGGVTVARHLLQLGHRRIAVISGPTEFLCARARLEACRATLDTAGTPLDDRRVRSGHFAYEDGLRLAEELRSAARPADRPGVRQRPPGPGRVPSRAPGRTADPRRTQRGRLRRHPDRPLVRSPADHRPATVLRHGPDRRADAAVTRQRRSPHAEPGRTWHNTHHPGQHRTTYRDPPETRMKAPLH